MKEQAAARNADCCALDEELDRELIERVLRAYVAVHSRPCAAKRSTTILIGDIDEREYLVGELLSVQSELDDIDFKKPEDVVGKFADFWEGGAARDLSQRDDPDDRKQQIVVAGEMSWGDEPGGYGYQMLKMASQYGLLELFGIS